MLYRVRLAMVLAMVKNQYMGISPIPLTSWHVKQKFDFRYANLNMMSTFDVEPKQGNCRHDGTWLLIMRENAILARFQKRAIYPRALFVSSMASSSASPPNNSQSPNAPTDGIIQALGNAFKSQTGGVLNNVQIAKLLQANIGQLGQLAKDGKLSQQQILQVKSILIIFEFRILIICMSKVEGICW